MHPETHHDVQQNLRTGVKGKSISVLILFALTKYSVLRGATGREGSWVVILE